MNDESKNEGEQSPDETNPVELSDEALESIAGGTKPTPKPEVPTESVTFNYGAIEWTYTKQK